MNAHLWANFRNSVLSHPLGSTLLIVACWPGIALACLLRPHSIRYVARFLFPLGALACLGMFLIAGTFLISGHSPEVMTLPLGLPDLPFHLRLDALSAFFLLILGMSGAGISTFAAGYFRSGEGTAPGLLGLHYHVFLASMAVVMLADDAYLFMVAWETMALHRTSLSPRSTAFRRSGVRDFSIS